MLPKNEHPTFAFELPLSKKIAKFRPMTVKEEKIFLLSESGTDARRDAIKQVISNCLVSNLDLDDLTYVDFESLFITLRSHSVDNMASIKLTIDGAEYDAKVALDSFKIRNKETWEKSKLMKYESEKAILFRNPTMADFDAFVKKTDPDIIDDMVVKCIDSVYIKDQVYAAVDFTPGELIEFFNTLPAKVLADFSSLFKNAPYLYFDVSVTLADGTTKNVEVRNFSDFF